MSDFLSRCYERRSSERATIEELLRHKWLKDENINTIDTTIKSGNDN